MRKYLSLAAVCILIPWGHGLGQDAILESQIEYRYVGHQEQTDDKGWLLVWEADISGDLTGTLRWWFAPEAPAVPGLYSVGELAFYEARWQISQSDEVILSGESTGKTDFRSNADGVWDGHGLVTEASGEYESLVGRRIYETGTVLIGEEPPVSFEGNGLFVIL